MPRGLRHVALSISFKSPMARRPDTLFATNMASLIFLPDLRLRALTSFQNFSRPSLSPGSSSRISLLKQSFSVSRPERATSRQDSNLQPDRYERPALLAQGKNRSAMRQLTSQ
jgi:hypothetical protein